MANKGTVLPLYDSTTLRVPFIYEFTELVRYRYLLWNLISRDLKVRYKRSFLGFLWTMLNPLLTMAVLVVVFSTMFQGSVEHFSIYLLSGLLLWNFFSQATTSAMVSLHANSPFLTQIYVPPSIFVASAMGGALINLLLALGPLMILALLNGVSLQISWLFLVVPIVQMAIFALGVGLILAPLAVFFADIQDIYAVGLTAFFYLTPIIYPISILPPTLVKIVRLNPMYYLINNVRTPLLEGRIPPIEHILIATLLALGNIIVGWAIFTRMADKFAYRI